MSILSRNLKALHREIWYMVSVFIVVITALMRYIQCNKETSRPSELFEMVFMPIDS